MNLLWVGKNLFLFSEQVTETEKNSHNRESLRQQISHRAEFLAHPQQSRLQRSWGNNLLRPFAFNILLPTSCPKDITEQQAHLATV